MKRKRSFFYSFARFLVIPFIKIFFYLKIEKKSEMPLYGRLIICANHSSLLDPILLSSIKSHQIHFMAKAELFKNFAFAAILKGLGAFSVTRGEQATAALNTAQDILKKEGIVGIFLEGTRSKDGTLLKPKSGAAMLSYQTNTPILPVCIKRVNGGPVRIFHKTKISVGTLIFPKKLQKINRSDLREMSDAIMEQIAKMKN